MNIRRFVVVVVALLAVVSGSASAQTIGPSRPGGNPMGMTSTAYPSSFGSPVVDAPVYGTLVMAMGTASTTSANISVPNAGAGFARLTFLGSTWSGVDDAANGLCRMALNVVNGTTVNVAALRAASAVAGNLTCQYMVEGISASLVKTVQIGSGNGSIVIASVNVSKTEIISAGMAQTVGGGLIGNLMGFCALTNATHVTCSNSSANGSIFFTVWEWF